MSESKWLLAIPMLSGGGNCESSFWMNEWILSLGKCEWFLSIPMLASGRNSKPGLGVDQWISNSGDSTDKSKCFH